MKYFRILLLFLSFGGFAQTLSPNTKVSLLTISPGEDLYSTFGHSAIRVTDPMQGLDQNYNYGSFDFNTPGFYIKFMRGFLNYQISSHNAYLELNYWNEENRLITEQALNLSLNQKQKLFDYLENNLRPENKEYRYKFFTDNCSTRLRDVLQIACGDSLVFDKTLKTDSTYRQWIDRYANGNHLEWADFGMDLALGTGSDQKTGWADAMFIPDNLMIAMDSAEVITENGKQKLVLSKSNLNQTVPITAKTWLTPTLFFGIFMFVVSFLTGAKILKSLLYDKIFFSILGIAGWVLFLLWFGTDHGVTTKNLNLLWASPLLFPAALFLGKKQWVSWVFAVYTLIFVPGFLYFNVFSSYKFSLPVLFIALAIGNRLFYLFKNKYIGFTRS